MALAQRFVLLALVALLAACSTVDASGYDKLNDAIVQANANAAVCGSNDSCVVTPVTLKLTEDVTITKELTALIPGAVLEIEGACSITTMGKCIVDGQKQFPALRSEDAGGSLGKLVLRNLIFQNCKGGALYRVWGTVNATNVIFQNNEGGAVIGAGGRLGNPPQRYTDCQFLENSGGSAITWGNFTYGGGNFGDYALYVSNSLFRGNRGPNGGAVFIAFVIETSVFEKTTFEGNMADGSGGAVYADQARLIQFRSVTFQTNTALSGSGGAVYGASGVLDKSNLNFCTCKFSKNVAPLNPSSNTLKTYTSTANADFKNNFPQTTTAAFCATPIPPGSDFQPRPYGRVITSKGGKCKKIYCSA